MDELSKVIAGESIQGISLEPLLKKRIDVEVLSTEVEYNWMTLFKQYIANGLLPDDSVVARKVKTSATRYVMVCGDLYRTMGDWPLLKRVFEDDGAYILREMHEGICGAHIGLALLSGQLRDTGTSG